MHLNYFYKVDVGDAEITVEGVGLCVHSGYAYAEVPIYLSDAITTKQPRSFVQRIRDLPVNPFTNSDRPSVRTWLARYKKEPVFLMHPEQFDRQLERLANPRPSKRFRA